VSVRTLSSGELQTAAELAVGSEFIEQLDTRLGTAKVVELIRLRWMYVNHLAFLVAGTSFRLEPTSGGIQVTVGEHRSDRLVWNEIANRVTGAALDAKHGHGRDLQLFRSP
jgi:hypothetical protein